MSALSSCWPLGVLCALGLAALLVSRPGGRLEFVGAILALSSVLAFPLCAWTAFS